MFTGIITAVGQIKSAQAKGDGLHLLVEVPSGYLDDVALGDSIAVRRRELHHGATAPRYRDARRCKGDAQEDHAELFRLHLLATRSKWLYPTAAGCSCGTALTFSSSGLWRRSGRVREEQERASQAAGRGQSSSPED
jgi:hypothetical protein